MIYQNSVQEDIIRIQEDRISDEIIFRDIIYKLISSIPIEELMKIFDCQKLDPFIDVRKTVNLSRLEWNHLRDLQRNNLIQYTVSINIGENDKEK